MSTLFIDKDFLVDEQTKQVISLFQKSFTISIDQTRYNNSCILDYQSDSQLPFNINIWRKKGSPLFKIAISRHSMAESSVDDFISASKPELELFEDFKKSGLFE